MIHGIQVIIRDEYNRGVENGVIKKLISQICKKLEKRKTPEQIAEE